MKLTDGFVAMLFRRARQGVEDITDVTVATADGVVFECPACAGTDHAHALRCWFADRNLPAELEPKPRWHAAGKSIADLTLDPSILTYPSKPCPGWHGHVRGGHTRNA